jgi:phosphoribosylformylglycinamidine synthase
VPVHRLEIEARPGLSDALGAATVRRLRSHLDVEATVRTRRIYLLDLDIDEGEAATVLDNLVDPVAEVGALGMLRDPQAEGEGAPIFLTVGLRPGVTDSVGRSVHRAAADCLGRVVEGEVYTAILYRVEGLDRARAERAAAELLYNPLIERLTIEEGARELDLRVPRAGQPRAPEVRTVALRGATDVALERISKEGVLALTVAEMRAIQAHFDGLGRDPTDAELECLAQTWSEHCKHKIFASPIDYVDPEGEARHISEGLFRAYIRGATEAVADARRRDRLDPSGQDFLVSVFHDNAGVIRFTDADHLVYKVETHNSPSALDPYGGAMTGIVGVNRDTLGTGLGADNLTNVWGYCFGPPEFDEPLPVGLMHPRRIREGVHHGVIDGGNQSGIPYSRGFELFDRRYVGKPLVYCGTVGVMPVSAGGRPAAEKEIRAGDRIVMVGGRIGKDGIHGATFSSVELGEDSPAAAVQIGDPITQKMMADFLAEAREAGLYSGLTDNGAGGLSSSVGEMAQATGGAELDLAAAPLKYPGLAPWEILISEAQERMTLAVRPEQVDALLELAARREVEATVLGTFTDSGRLVVRHGELEVCDLDLEFLHDGVPLPTLSARWSPPPRAATAADELRVRLADDRAGELLLELLSRPNLASGESLARSYDHEVKGLSVIKPWVGVRQDVPATATVMRVRHGRPEGIVLGEGIHPYYSDLDTYAMATAAVDEGVRRVLCGGARFDRIAALDNFCWPDPILSPKTPDGEHKLAQLVRCCEGLRAACEAYGVPLISGKDSMKNDANLGGVKISIPPTLLVSVLGQIDDVRGALDLTPLAAGDRIAILGPTADELGESELVRALGLVVDSVPRTDLAACAARYRAFAAIRDAGLVRSAHVVGRGGLAVALAQMTVAGGLGLEIDVAAMAGDLASVPAIFSESTGRIVLTCEAADAAAVEAGLGAHGLCWLGEVGPPLGWLHVRRGGETVLGVGVEALRRRLQRQGERR